MRLPGAKVCPDIKSLGAIIGESAAICMFTDGPGAAKELRNIKTGKPVLVIISAAGEAAVLPIVARLDRQTRRHQ